MGEHLRVNGSLQKHKKHFFLFEKISAHKRIVYALATTTSTKNRKTYKKCIIFFRYTQYCS